jgi:phage protein D
MSALLADVYVPDCEVSIGGGPIPAALRASMTSVRFDESMEGANRVEVQFANQNLVWLDHPLLQLTSPLDLSLGYRSSGLTQMFKGTVTGVDPHFPANGMPTITISAHDYMLRLTEGTKQRAFPWFLPDSVVAVIVAAENFLITEPDPVSAVAGALNVFNQRPRYQYKVSDYRFLRAMAAEYGFDMWVDGDFMNFKFLRPGVPPPEIELNWGTSLVDFSPKHTSIGQIVAVTFKVYVQEIKTSFGITVKWDGDTIGIRVMPAMFAEQLETVEATIGFPDIPLDSPVDAIKFVLGEIRRRVNHRTTGKGSAVGDPRLRVGEVLTLSGIGDGLSGSTYRLTSVSHSLDASGYKTSFEVRRELI